MNKLSNPEAFQIEAAEILAASYKAFPSEITWNYDPDNQNYPTTEGKHRPTIQRDTIQWLVTQGYLNCDDPYAGIGNEWEGFVLSEKGLVALNSVPDAISGKDPLGKRLISATAKNSLDLVKQLIPLIIQQASTQ